MHQHCNPPLLVLSQLEVGQCLALGYEILQACTSILVSKLCKFHLPNLVNFVNKLVVCFPPLPYCLGLPVFTKKIVNNCLYVSWGRPQFLLFFPNFGPLLRLQYMIIHIEACPLSCRYGEYISFASLITPITVLGTEQFAFPC